MCVNFIIFEACAMMYLISSRILIIVPSKAGLTTTQLLLHSLPQQLIPSFCFQVYYMMMVHKGRKASDKEAVKNADLADLDVEVSDQNIESEDDVEVSDQDVESVDILDVEVFHANLESEEDDGDIKLSVSGSI